jgi:cob(I)alamin adenosyltransferase
LGTVHLYTGDGPGLSAIALGHALRGIAAGGRVFYVRFLAGTDGDGLAEVGRHLAPRMEIRTMGREIMVDPRNPDPVDVKWAEDGLSLAARAGAREEWDLVILDEVLTAQTLGLLEADRLLEALDGRRSEIDWVLTGRQAAPELVAAADRFTTLTRVK